MDCQKLSIDACMHAAQNERLPLRVVVQILFSEQVKISNAIANSTLNLKHHQDSAASAADVARHFSSSGVLSTRKQLLEGTPQSFQEGWAAAKKDINTLKFEVESMKVKYLELQTDMDNLQRQFEKTMSATTSTKPAGKHATSAWSSGWRKLSRLTKMGLPENQMDIGDQMQTGDGAVARKGAEEMEEFHLLIITRTFVLRSNIWRKKKKHHFGFLPNNHAMMLTCPFLFYLAVCYSYDC
ncbi:hypothetical protein HPP92_005980 [Vanilla planifolia]|uniref:NPH3 domain-containing protein n=1 Tax=Vanilla planifolia TaxID=51239 RepID=A0A835RV29_VANPL|nr:hypothetical protein HPP92_005973 [Vanilla planifolia]KAG0492582.1 hypothetical protein HPP92_005980 [Vanilla planifolia]